jgi:hypothetical protein
MFQNLMGGQLEALARKIHETYPDVPLDEALGLAQTHASTIDLQQAAKGKGKRGKSKGPRKPKAPLDPESQCMARVWRTGNGNDQCSLRRTDHMGFTCYCKRHSGQAAISETPCTRGDDGYSHLGLWFGRIDQDRPWLDANGVVAIEWDTVDHKQQVEESVADGSHPRHVKAKTYKGNKKAKKTKKSKKESPSTVSDEGDLSTLLALQSDGESKPKVSFKVSKASVETNDIDDDVQNAFDMMDEDGDGVITKEEFAKQAKRGSIVNHIVPPPKVDDAVNCQAEDDLDDLLSDSDDDEQVGDDDDAQEVSVDDEQVADDDEAEEVSVDVMTDSNGKQWYVDGAKNAFDMETEKNLGTWNEDNKCVDLFD